MNHLNSIVSFLANFPLPLSSSLFPTCFFLFLSLAYYFCGCFQRRWRYQLIRLPVWWTLATGSSSRRTTPRIPKGAIFCSTLHDLQSQLQHIKPCIAFWLSLSSPLVNMHVYFLAVMASHTQFLKQNKNCTPCI